MDIAVRYFSKFGRTEKIARAIAKGASVEAVSVADENELDKKYDILFLGGAPYANIMDSRLRKWVEQLSPDKVGTVVLFTTSNWSRRTIYGIKKILKNKGIDVQKETFYAHMLKIDSRIQDAEIFAGNMVKKLEKNNG